MTSVEKKIIEFTEKYLLIIVFCLGTIISLFARSSLKDCVSNDYLWHLEGWYDTIKQNGGIRALSEQVGDYNVLYQFCIAVMTYFPVRSLYAYKILSCIFDYILAIVVGILVYDISGEFENMGTEKRRWCALLGYFCVLFSPIVILNSAAWAQCDAIYTSFIALALLLLAKEKHIWAFVALGFAFSFKLQAFFILPAILFIYYKNKKFSILNFIIIPATMVVTGLPAVFMGRSIPDIFTVYSNQTTTYKAISLNYPSFWNILINAYTDEHYENIKTINVIIPIVVLAAFMVYWVVSDVKMTKKNIVYVAFILTYACVLFLPQMHERYGYIYEALAVIIAIINKRTIKLIIPLYILTITTYGNFLFGLSHVVDIYTSIINILVFVWYVYELDKDMKAEIAELA